MYPLAVIQSTSAVTNSNDCVSVIVRHAAQQVTTCETVLHKATT